MKSFFQFLESAAQQAARLGLDGGWAWWMV